MTVFVLAIKVVKVEEKKQPNTGVFNFKATYSNQRFESANSV